MATMDRKRAIQEITKMHQASLKDCIAASTGEYDSHRRGLSFGNMLGLENAAYFAGLETLSEELAQIRQNTLTKLKDHTSPDRDQVQANATH